MAIPPVLYFEIRQGGELVRKDQSDQAAIKIGSHQKSHLYIDDPEVSRVHAVVEKGDAGVFVIDLGSGRPTFVNGERVSKKQLNHGDVLKLGGTELVFLTHDERAVASEQRRRAFAIDPRTSRPRDEVLYARRFLARPATTDGSVEVAMLWRDHVMAEEVYRPPRDLIVGSGRNADFVIEHASIGDGDLVLVSAEGGEPILQFPIGLEGELYVGTERFSLADAVASGKAKPAGKIARIPLTQETRAKLVFGEVVLFLHRSTKAVLALPVERRAAAPLFFLLFSAALHTLLLLLIMFLPPGIGDLALDSFGARDRFVQLLVEDVEPEPEEVEEIDEGEDDQEEQLAEGDEGRAGEETAEDEPARMAIEGDLPEGEMELARQEALVEVQDRGALAVLNQQSMGPSSIFGAGPMGSDAVTAIGAVQGDEIGASYGSRGLGAYGGGLSGGGRHTGQLRGAGSLALRGRSSGNDSDLGQNLRAVTGREALRPSVVPGTPDIRGQLDRDIIARVIREHRREIRACYEDQLQRFPDLEGRVMVSFVIAPDGAVAGATISESSLRNDAVEECVTRRVRQWRFPEPRGGGTVNVNYPFVFSSGG